ncbi:MAG: two-component system response regulator [Comamonadaceae bacterium CG1_02_60_18]|nr:MAG: two-component system response regulator [Comamonadaceae bacterium CG1_02_60_18]
MLCVDDEPSILSALRRLFRANGLTIQVATSGAEGLDLLEQQPFDVVVSDMRMPQMDGVAFLEQVRQRWPDTLRLLLTGYADVNAIMGAINRGEIYRYIAKPWDDNDMVLIVRGALQQFAMAQEQKRLQTVVAEQNEALKQLNQSLELKVCERTAELQQSNERLKGNFVTSIKVFTNLIEMRNAKLAGHSRRVADLARRVAQRLALPARQVQEIFVAGLLHEIGKVGFDDVLLDTPVVTMNTTQLQAYRTHPTRAVQMLMPLDELKGAADMIGSQLERFDGAGYPQQLSGALIPLGARILSATCDLDSLQIGILGQTELSLVKALDVLRDGSGRRYDPQVVQALLGVIHDEQSGLPQASPEMDCRVSDLVPGMVLSRDFMTPNGLLMLTAGHVLDDVVIARIHNFERSLGASLRAQIWRAGAPPAQAPKQP